MAAKGWDAKGLLQPLWQNYPGKRDGLAAAVGTTGSTLSAINTGNRNLGVRLAQRLADELGVTIYDVGSDLPPAIEARAREQLLADDTRTYVELVRKWSERGLSDQDALQWLNDAESALGDECAPCVSTLARERATYR